jgi:protein gp37
MYSPSFDVVKMIPGRFARAASWSDMRGRNRAGTTNAPYKPWLNGFPRMIFVGDMGDFLSRDVTDEFLMNELFAAMTSEQGKRHFWLLLTKKIRRLAELSKRMPGGLPDNCMAMTTATDQRTAETRVPQLLKVDCRWRGLSCEPMLGPIDLLIDGECSDWQCRECGSRNVNPDISTTDGSVWECADCKYSELGDCDWTSKLDWVIAGGESGNSHEEIDQPRPMDTDWLRALRDDCVSNEVPFFFKQWGAWFPADKHHGDLIPKASGEHTYAGDGYMLRGGKGLAGANLDGREWKEMPALALNGTR